MNKAVPHPINDEFQAGNILGGLNLSGCLIQLMYGQPSTYNDQDNINAPTCSAMDADIEAQAIDQHIDNSRMNQQVPTNQ